MPAPDLAEPVTTRDETRRDAVAACEYAVDASHHQLDAAVAEHRRTYTAALAAALDDHDTRLRAAFTARDQAIADLGRDHPKEPTDV